MTSKLLQIFPKRGGTFQIEPDASSGSYFWAAGKLLGEAGNVRVAHWPASGWQVDERFPELLKAMGSSTPLRSISRAQDLGDSIMSSIVLAPFSTIPIRFTDLGRLRLQECERVAALRTELSRCGARILEEGDTLTVSPSELHGAEIETYGDHRMAMCFAIPGLKVPRIRIRNPACVKKTFPDFFQKLAAAPPKGLGARIHDGGTGRGLSQEELFAD